MKTLAGDRHRKQIREAFKSREPRTLFLEDRHYQIVSILKPIFFLSTVLGGKRK